MIGIRSARARLARAEVLKKLRKFNEVYNRPPSRNDPNIKNLVYPAIKEFGSWRNALKIAGLQTSLEWRRRNSLQNRIAQALEHNPLTRQEMKEYFKSKGLSCLTRLIKQGRVRSIGPKRRAIYYLLGQEEIARTKLEASDHTEDGLIEELLLFLKEPRTIEEIKEALPLTIKNETILKDLVGANIVFKRKFTLSGRGVKHRYNALTLFGDLAFKTYYCRLDATDEFASFILNKRQLKPRVHSVGFRRSLTSHLKTLLPKEVFTVVHAGMLKAQ